ncbi:hypothetical protein FVEN_g4404 [Fusarium venenatum]|uniref:Uncharacterized protein n=1 Tax=Fusarium venenatum TaxID=56646 RepID=A0A2L2T8B8_9HYPO|nr:uncharacterized protein FVRRES_02710 [Fusarium venenatum]KAG8357773.1 hypothetical protein FVEN_g4404 [Fusarium venenatum]KAH7004206.1 hypothetical protein EDB82DRAFT_486315 [Fusarium venenatum]CEI66198.1 unnamed protein product [Fusarium venenatum]
MSSSPCLDLDIQHSTKAVIQWQSDTTTHILAKPDPQVSSVTLNFRFDKTCAFFELSVPVKIKGLDTTTAVTLRACASSIVSLVVVKNPTVLIKIQQEFESAALCLNVTLNHHLNVLVPTPALEPLSPARKHSGVVLDAIRDLSNATVLSIYVEARAAPPSLQSISDAASDGRLKSFRSLRYNLASMYGGLGAKLVHLLAQTALPPPAYDEAGSPPPPPPIDCSHTKKRPRQDSQSSRDSDIALIWDELRALKETRGRDREQIEALETENKRLRQENEELVRGMDKMRERCTALEDDFGVLNKSTEGFMDTYDNELTELRDDIHTLEGIVNFIQEGQVSDESVKKIKDAVVKDITTRLSAD